MNILEILTEALRYFFVRLNYIFLFISVLVLYLMMFKAGNKIGKKIMEIYNNFNKINKKTIRH